LEVDLAIFAEGSGTMQPLTERRMRICGGTS
jgi:hypothetical protein